MKTATKRAPEGAPAFEAANIPGADPASRNSRIEQRNQRGKERAAAYGIAPGLAIAILAVHDEFPSDPAYVFQGDGPHFSLTPVDREAGASEDAPPSLNLRVVAGPNGGDVKISKSDMETWRANNVTAIAWVWKTNGSEKSRTTRAVAEDYRPVGVVSLDKMVELVRSWHFPSRELISLKDVAALYV